MHDPHLKQPAELVATPSRTLMSDPTSLVSRLRESMSALQPVPTYQITDGMVFTRFELSGCKPVVCYATTTLLALDDVEDNNFIDRWKLVFF